MIKVLIIDDEEPARQAIRALGGWERYGIEAVLEAVDGREGLDVLRAEKPDLVFVDMKMPHVGGAAFLAEAVREHAACKFVVVSGYDDFQYTRQAVKAGAMDYLLKPVKKRELQQIVAHAVEAIERERSSRLSRSIRENLTAPLLKEQFFSSILERDGRFSYLNELHEMIGWDGDVKEGVIGLIRLMNGEDVLNRRFGGDLHAFRIGVTNLLNETLAGPGKAFSFKDDKFGRDFAVVVEVRGEREAGKTADGLCQAMERLKALFGLDGIAAWCGQPRAMSRMDVSYQEARRTLRSVNLLRMTECVYSRCSADAGSGPSVLSQRERLRHALESGSAHTAARIVEMFFAGIRESGVFTIADQERAAFEFRLLLEQLLRDLALEGETARELLAEYDRKRFSGLLPAERFMAETAAFAGEAFRRMIGELAPGEAFDPEKIKHYIDRHFFEDISISLFADMFFVSKEHLLRQFKQKYGCGIYEYTLRVRMEQAKRLLRDPSITVTDVAAQVGYHDDGYFRKAFKKSVGVSPNAYRAAKH